MSILGCIIYSYLNLVPYWNNPQIHNFGNTGLMGSFHALISPIVTKYIDSSSYGGKNVRKLIFNTADGKVLDMCCGTGYSTKPGSIGIDTSLEMLRFSKLFNPGSEYIFGNAERFGNDEEFDTVTIMFSFHEIPSTGQRKIINNAIRIARKTVIIVDISKNYEPTELMLSGEPYLQEYLNNFENLLSYYYSIGRGIRWKKTNIVKDRVDMWEYTKSDTRLLAKGVSVNDEEKVQIMSDRAFWRRRKVSFESNRIAKDRECRERMWADQAQARVMEDYNKRISSYSYAETWNDNR